MKNKIKQIEKISKKYFKGMNGCHDFEHTNRVRNLAIHIGKVEGGDLEVIEIAALLHDIGRKKQDKSKGKICHAEAGAEMAKEILLDFDLEKEKFDNIIHCIESHRFRKGKIPETLEAKIVYDADKLDGIGAVGIGRAFLFAGDLGAKLHNKDVDIKKTKSYTKDDTAYREFTIKLNKIKDKIQTTEGKKIAEDRHNFMLQFFDRLDKEVDGDL